MAIFLILEKAVNENFGLDIHQKSLLNHLFILFISDFKILVKLLGTMY